MNANPFIFGKSHAQKNSLSLGILFSGQWLCFQINIVDIPIFCVLCFPFFWQNLSREGRSEEAAVQGFAILERDAQGRNNLWNFCGTTGKVPIAIYLRPEDFNNVTAGLFPGNYCLPFLHPKLQRCFNWRVSSRFFLAISATKTSTMSHMACFVKIAVCYFFTKDFNNGSPDQFLRYCCWLSRHPWIQCYSLGILHFCPDSGLFVWGHHAKIYNVFSSKTFGRVIYKL